MTPNHPKWFSMTPNGSKKAPKRLQKALKHSKRLWKPLNASTGYHRLPEVNFRSILWTKITKIVKKLYLDM